MKLSTDAFYQALSAELDFLAKPSSKLVVAFSGGVDSAVLLHLCWQLRESGQLQSLRAIHVDHGLQDDSAEWAKFCQVLCQQYKISIEIITVKLRVAKGDSLEAVARTERYKAFENNLQKNEILLTAQHQDDQAETLLIQLMRGSGVKGLAAMPAVKDFGSSILCRPLLNFSRESIEIFADAEKLKWIEDPSNQDLKYTRNFIRHKIMPVLKSRWPTAAGIISTTASHAADAAEVLDELAKSDYEYCVNDCFQLVIYKLKRLSRVRIKNVINCWLKIFSHPLASPKHLHEILKMIFEVDLDKNPMVNWSDTQVRRFDDKLFVMQALEDFDSSQTFTWDTEAGLYIPTEPMALKRYRMNFDSFGIADEDIPVKLTVKYRQGGEKLRLPNGQHQDLKKVFQDRKVPPWLRDRTPLLFDGDELIAIYIF